MNIIDQTPYFDQETGEIKLLDRVRAVMNYGTNWLKEVEAQSQVISLMTKLLDKNFTLLHNVTPPGLDASFPLILVGPTGVFVMYVTQLTGTFRAKGDQWGTISGNNFKDVKPNLLSRTEHMARALQIFLQHQEQTGLTIVEAILLCSDPAVHVDSLRPIIRIVMRDALERFIISISQSRVALSPDAVQRIIGNILNPPKPVEPQPAETEPEVNDGYPVDRFNELIHASVESHPPALNNEPGSAPQPMPQTNTPLRWWKAITKKQWAFLIAMFVIWILLVAFFLILMIKGQV
jgi:hypothetical protein